MSTTSHYSSMLFVGVYTCSLCNILAKYALLIVITVDTQACLRVIEDFKEKTRSRCFSVREYCKIRESVLRISDRSLYLYFPSTCMVACELVGAFVLMFLPFRVDFWIIFVLLITVELSFNVCVVQRISAVNSASELLSTEVLESFEYFAEGSAMTDMCNGKDMEIPYMGDGGEKFLKPVFDECSRLSLSVVCLSKPIVFASMGIVWTNTKFRYQLLASLFSCILFLSKYIYSF
jgi:hypothetical protein